MIEQELPKLPEHPDSLELVLHAMNNSARMLETQKRYAEAQALMRRSLELKPTQGDVVFHFLSRSRSDL